MKIILLGPPGVGKGTQAKIICEKFNIQHISTGDMLRDAVNTGESFSQEIRKIIEAGQLVSDDLILQIVEHRIRQDDCKNGYLLDGVPRTLVQAKGMEKFIGAIDFILEMYAQEQQIIERISGRRIHPASGRIYHMIFNPPKVENIDDDTGEPLEHRNDDTEQMVQERLRVYREQTLPLVDYYNDYIRSQPTKRLTYLRINGYGTMQEVSDNILNLLEQTHK